MVVRVSGHDDRGHAWVAVAEGAEQTETIEPRHHDIRHQYVHNPPIGERERLIPVGCGQHTQVIAFQGLAAQLTDHPLVIHDQDDRSKVKARLMQAGV
jgi:hypothetical protein